MCGGDCDPDTSLSADGAGMRIAFICPGHGMQSVVDPLSDLRWLLDCEEYDPGERKRTGDVSYGAGAPAVNRRDEGFLEGHSVSMMSRGDKASTIFIVSTDTVMIRASRSRMYRGSQTSRDQSFGSLTMPDFLSDFT